MKASLVASIVLNVILGLIVGRMVNSNQGAGKDKVADLWTKEDEDIFQIMRDKDPSILRQQVAILANASSPSKRMLAVDYLAYDRCYPDAPGTFGKDFRVILLSKLVSDESEEVRKHAETCIVNSLIESEKGVITPLLQSLVNNREAQSALSRLKKDEK